MNEPDPTGDEQTKDTKFQPGQSGNPSGRPKGSRNKLGEEFLSKLYADFKQHGEAAIQRVRDEKPDAYLKVVASILPQKLEIEHVDNLTDDERRNRIREIAEQLGGLASLIGRVDGTAASRETAAGPDTAVPLPTLQ